MIHAQSMFDAYLTDHPAPKSKAFLAGVLHGFAEITGELPKSCLLYTSPSPRD